MSYSARARFLIGTAMLFALPTQSGVAEENRAAKKNSTVAKKITAAPRPRWTDPVTGLDFVLVAKGCFQMGTALSIEPSEDHQWKHLGFKGPLNGDERPVHRVCLDAFWIGTTEVTAQAWEKVMAGKPPFGINNEPVAGVDIVQTEAFLARLGEMSAGQYRYRLPTEAEWEYACRAGRKDDAMPPRLQRIDDAWYSAGDFRVDKPQPVAQLAANSWGLHDMLGNVWEWTRDVYAANAYASHVLYNPVMQIDPLSDRVVRGGSFRSEYLQVRCASRSRYPVASSLRQIGFRIVREVP